jgi:hypothetical protein
MSSWSAYDNKLDAHIKALKKQHYLKMIRNKVTGIDDEPTITTSSNQSDGNEVVILYLVSSLPTEIRYLIYDILMQQPHQLYIGFPLPSRGPLESLSQTCHHFRVDVETWRLRTTYKRDELFGIVNPAITTVALRIIPRVSELAIVHPEYFWPFRELFRPCDEMRQYVYLTWYGSICQNEGRDFDSTADFFRDDFDEGLEMDVAIELCETFGSMIECGMK